MESKQLSIWEQDYYDKFVSEDLKIIYDRKHRDLTSKVILDSKFNYLSREKLDFEVMDNLLTNKYAKKKVPKLLLKTLSEFSGKSKESVSVYEMFWLYNSLNSLFDGEINSSNLNKWSDKNRDKISRFGISQYELLEDYLKNLDLI